MSSNSVYTKDNDNNNNKNNNGNNSNSDSNIALTYTHTHTHTHTLHTYMYDPYKFDENFKATFFMFHSIVFYTRMIPFPLVIIDFFLSVYQYFTRIHFIF